MRIRGLVVAVAALAVLGTGGCEGERAPDGGEGAERVDSAVPFEVIADTSEPAIARAVLAPDEDFRMGPVMPGVEVAATGIARSRGEVAALWRQAGFSESPPALPDGEALLLLAGGESSSCPWEVQRISNAGDEISAHLGTPGEKVDCGGPWQPRALALTVPANELPQDPVFTIGGVERPVPSLSPQIRLTPDGPRAFQRKPPRYELSPDREALPAPEAQLAHPNPLAVTSFPGFDLIQLRLDWRKQDAQLTADYVADPPVDVTGDAFLRLRLPNTATSAPLPRRLEAPPQAAITEVVRVSAGDPLTWIVGVKGEKSPLVHWSSTYESPDFTGWAHVLGVRHGTE